MSSVISNLNDTIDSRDVIARIEELEGYEADLDVLDTEELTALKKLAEQGENSTGDWEYGVQLIHEDYFETAMDEMLEDTGDIPRDLPCYLTITVDYDALKQDYTEIDFYGQTYLVR